MAGKKQRKAATGQAATAQAATPEEAANQSVLQHYAKTVYFNDLWVGFLGKMAGLVFLMSYMVLQRMRQSADGLTFLAAFEALSILIAVSTALFIRRFFNPLLAFKVAFAFSLLQALWFGMSYTKRRLELPRDQGDLSSDQMPFGLIYFVICWGSDRFMLRSRDIAKEAADGMQEVLHNQRKAKTQ